MPNTDYDIIVAPQFYEARDIAAQIAGFLLLGSAHRNANSLVYSALAERMRLCTEGLSSLLPPENARHFHHHLSAGVETLSFALATLEHGRQTIKGSVDPLPALKHGWQEIQHAAALRPGFEVIDFKQSCCAVHTQMRYAPNATSR